MELKIFVKSFSGGAEVTEGPTTGTNLFATSGKGKTSRSQEVSGFRTETERTSAGSHVKSEKDERIGSAEKMKKTKTFGNILMRVSFESNKMSESKS